MSSELTENQIENRLINMCRHGFDLSIIHLLDLFQINILISHCNNLGSTQLSLDAYPKKEIAGYFTKLPKNFKIPKDVLTKVYDAFSCKKDRNKLFGEHRFRAISGTVPKHFYQKTGAKGKTCAILSEDSRSFVFFLEYMLCFHAFCKYSYTLPDELRTDNHLIDYGSRSLIEYYSKIIYRGDESVDCRTTKVHSNIRAGFNYILLGSCIHADCQTGERLLKTKAKKISSTAQKRGNSHFEQGTMHRIQEETLLSQFELHLLEQQETQDKTDTKNNDNECTCNVTRRSPNFRYEPSTSKWYHVNRKGKLIEGDQDVGIIPEITNAFLREEPSMEVYEIHCEIQLRDKSRVRATPNYSKSGPWYDMVYVKWQVGDELGACLYPARCLAFYTKKNPDTGEIVETKALVHGTNLPSPDQVIVHKDTLLTSHYYFEWESNTSKRKRNDEVVVWHPKIYSINVSSIESSVMWFPHKVPGSNPRSPPFDPSNTGIMVVRPRNEWAYLWMAWNKALRQRNKTNVSRNKVYVDLADDHLVRQVRKKLDEILTSTHRLESIEVDED